MDLLQKFLIKNTIEVVQENLNQLVMIRHRETKIWPRPPLKMILLRNSREVNKRRR
jgi:hypothetical protein